MFIAEILGGVLYPLFCFIDPQDARKSRWDRVGFFLHHGRVDLEPDQLHPVFLQWRFLPAGWSELAVSIGLTCLGFIMFDAAVRFLPMFPEPKPEVTKSL